MRRGLYLDLRKVAEAPFDEGYPVARHHRLHTVYRTLEHLGWMVRVEEEDSPPLSRIWWTLSVHGWREWHALEAMEASQARDRARERARIRDSIHRELEQAGELELCTCGHPRCHHQLGECYGVGGCRCQAFMPALPPPVI